MAGGAPARQNEFPNTFGEVEPPGGSTIQIPHNESALNFIAFGASFLLHDDRATEINIIRRYEMRIVTMAVMGAALVGLNAFGEGRDAANYVGLKTCGMCHKSEAGGNQLGKWQETAHSKAYELLGTDKAKEVGKKVGVDNPQTSGKCLKCHATAYNFTETQVANEKLDPKDGVTCESCHGPGKDYKSIATMKDREAAVKVGLIYPATQSCKLCHNEQNPAFKPFDEKSYVEKIAHPDPRVKH